MIISQNELYQAVRLFKSRGKLPRRSILRALLPEGLYPYRKQETVGEKAVTTLIFRQFLRPDDVIRAFFVILRRKFDS